MTHAPKPNRHSTQTSNHLTQIGPHSFQALSPFHPTELTCHPIESIFFYPTETPRHSTFDLNQHFTLIRTTIPPNYHSTQKNH